MIDFYAETKKSYKAIIRFAERTYSNFYKNFDIVRTVIHAKLQKNMFQKDKEIVDVIKLIDNFDREMFTHSVKEFSLYELIVEGVEMFYEKAQKDNIQMSVFKDKHIEHKVFVGSDLKYLHIFKSIMNMALNMIMSSGKISVNVVYSGVNKAVVFVSISGKLLQKDFYLQHIDKSIDKALCHYGCIDEVIDMAKEFGISVFCDVQKTEECVFRILVGDCINSNNNDDQKSNVVRLF
jgi:hypothetical protein